MKHNYMISTVQPVIPSDSNRRLTAFWDNNTYDGTNPSYSTTQGLAEFTNANFFSDFTIPFANPLVPVRPEHTFPQPGLDYYANQYHLCNETNGSGKIVQYLSRSTCPTSGPIDHFLVASLLNTRDGAKYFFWTDDKVHETYAKEIIPRAVGYSAGLLNYFFRGTLDVSWPETGVYSIADGSQTPYTANGNHHQQFTKINAAIRNTTPNEAIGVGILTAVARYKIIPNYAPDLSNYPPNGAEMTEVQYSHSVSQPFAVPGISAVNYTDIPFDFTPSPIPAGITDLTLQVVFKGTIGNEAENAIAVGMKDIMEPTHLTFWNLSDMFSLQYPGSDYELYTFDKLQTMAQTNASLLNWLDYTKDGTLDDELYLQPFTSTFTISFWNNLTMIPAVTVDIPAGGYVRLIVLANQNAGNYLKLDWQDPVSSDSVTIPFNGVVNQADQNGIYNVPTPVYYFRQQYASDGQTLVPIIQHNHIGIVGCQPRNGSIYCPYSDEDADPVSLPPIPFSSVFN
jgi:hypothetical protein